MAKLVKYLSEADGGTVQAAKESGEKVLKGLSDAEADVVFRKLNEFTDPQAFSGVSKLVESSENGANQAFKFIDEVSEANQGLIETAMKNVGEFNDLDNVAAFGRLTDDLAVDDLAEILVNPLYGKDFLVGSPNAIYEPLVESIDFLRTPGGDLIAGINTIPAGSGASSLISQIKGATNARGFAFEPVATKTLLTMV